MVKSFITLALGVDLKKLFSTFKDANKLECFHWKDFPDMNKHLLILPPSSVTKKSFVTFNTCIDVIKLFFSLAV
jgi:hypothetical protein